MLAGILLNLDGGAGGKRRRERRRVVIDDRLYVVDDGELRQLLGAWVATGEAPKARTVPKRKRGPIAEATIAMPALPTFERRAAFVAEQFVDEFPVIEMLRRLIAEMDEEDVEVIALWH